MKFKSDIELQASLKDSSGDPGVAGQVLSSTVTGTDWINAGGGGSGNTNYVSKFTSGTVLGDSSIFDNGTNVGIGTASPAATVHIKTATSTSQIKMSAASNVSNYAYMTMTDQTSNTAKFTIGTTYGSNAPLDAISIYNRDVTLYGSLGGVNASFTSTVSASTVPTSNSHLTNKLYVDTAVAALSGTSIQRVAATSTPVGVSFWDTDLKIPCYLESTIWYNAAGGVV